MTAKDNPKPNCPFKTDKASRVLDSIGYPTATKISTTHHARVSRFLQEKECTHSLLIRELIPKDFRCHPLRLPDKKHVCQKTCLIATQLIVGYTQFFHQQLMTFLPAPRHRHHPKN